LDYAADAQRLVERRDHHRDLVGLERAQVIHWRSPREATATDPHAGPPGPGRSRGPGTAAASATWRCPPAAARAGPPAAVPRLRPGWRAGAASAGPVPRPAPGRRRAGLRCG